MGACASSGQVPNNPANNDEVDPSTPIHNVATPADIPQTTFLSSGYAPEPVDYVSAGVPYSGDVTYAENYNYASDERVYSTREEAENAANTMSKHPAGSMGYGAGPTGYGPAPAEYVPGPTGYAPVSNYDAPVVSRGYEAPVVVSGGYNAPVTNYDAPVVSGVSGGYDYTGQPVSYPATNYDMPAPGGYQGVVDRTSGAMNPAVPSGEYQPAVVGPSGGMPYEPAGAYESQPAVVGPSGGMPYEPAGAYESQPAAPAVSSGSQPRLHSSTEEVSDHEADEAQEKPKRKKKTWNIFG